MVEVFENGQFANCGTVDLTNGGVKSAFERALKLADKCSRHKIHSFDAKARPSNSGSYSSTAKQSIDSYPLQKFRES